MARGHWRNWDEVECPKCNARFYRKYVKGNKCPACGTKLIKREVSNESSTNFE